jgi:hypothetical protein
MFKDIKGVDDYFFLGWTNEMYNGDHCDHRLMRDLCMVD